MAHVAGSAASACNAKAQAGHDAAASAYGAGMARFELGLISARELGALRGKATRAENALSIARSNCLGDPVPVALATSWSRDADGVYRATLTDGRGVWAWAFAPGDWRYGLLWGCEDVPCSYAAPRRHLALASWVRPGERPDVNAARQREWRIHPVTGDGASLAMRSTSIADGLRA